MNGWKRVLVAAAFAISTAATGQAAIIISEVDMAGSATTTYAADWIELTNTGAATEDITGWKMDDSSNSWSVAVPLRGITSITAGQSVVFVEGKADGSTDATIQTNFINTWFGGTAPAGFAMGFYGGSGVGLSQSGDGVNIFDALATHVAGVSFGATTLGATLDNAAGLDGVAISTVSAAGTNGAFVSTDSVETGSPGTIANVPEPGSLGALAMTGLALLIRRRR
jgi:hypothetical protein